MSFMLVAGILSAAAALFSQAEAGLGNQENQEIPGGLTPSPRGRAIETPSPFTVDSIKLRATKTWCFA